MTSEQKEIVKEGEGLEEELKGGKPDAVPRSIAFLIRQQRVQMFSEFVTDKECRNRMLLCPGAKPPPVQKPPFTWAAAFATVSSIAIFCGTLFAIFH
jgi:hypothetical protein